MPASEPPEEAPRVGLRVEALTRTFADFELGPVSLALRPGESLVVVGPNGSGKTTLLRLLAGLEPATSGRVWLGQQDITGLPPHRRGVGMVFQDLALFPHKNVWENVTYGLAVRGVARRRVEERGRELLEEYRLEELASRLPSQLSGGERQRVALARALAPSPGVLLMDEPLASADPRIARHLALEIRQSLRTAGVATVFVTHDLEEAHALGDRLALLERGTWMQEGPLEEVFAHPASPFAAWFLGYNVLPPGPGRTGPSAVLPEDIRRVPPEHPGATPAIVHAVHLRGRRRRILAALGTAAPEGRGSVAPEDLLEIEEVLPRPPAGPRAGPEGGPPGPEEEEGAPGGTGASGGSGARAPQIGERIGVVFDRTVGLGEGDPPAGFMKGRRSSPDHPEDR